MKKLVLLFSVLLSTRMAVCEVHESFKGVAKQNGVVVYEEVHDVTFDDSKKVLEATTKYTDPSGKLLGVLKSNFRVSLNLPEHEFRDERTKNVYGIRRVDGRDLMFSQEDGKKEVQAPIESSESSGRTQIGCQGFSYFLKDKLDFIKGQKSIPVLFLIPGDLQSYKFVLEFVKENDDRTVEFRVKIENWFLRAFAPELEFRYDPKISRITWYKGISNIKDAKGKTMNVTIEYQ